MSTWELPTETLASKGHPGAGSDGAHSAPGEQEGLGSSLPMG